MSSRWRNNEIGRRAEYTHSQVRSPPYPHLLLDILKAMGHYKSLSGNNNLLLSYSLPELAKMQPNIRSIGGQGAGVALGADVSAKLSVLIVWPEEPGG